MKPQFVIYADSIPKNVPESVYFIRHSESHEELFSYLEAYIRNSTTISFSAFEDPIQTLLQADFSERYAFGRAAMQPNVSLYEIENYTLIDLLGAEDYFESHYAAPEFRTVKLGSKRDVRAIFKLARMLSQNFDNDKPVLGQSSSVCRFLLTTGERCYSIHIISNGIAYAFYPSNQASILCKYFTPILKMSHNVFVIIATGAEQIYRALGMCNIEFVSREITLNLQADELYLTPIDEILQDYDEALELSKLEENSISYEKDFLQASQLALYYSVYHIIESGIDDSLQTAPLESHVEDEKLTSADIVRQVNFYEPTEMYREFSDNIKQQEAHDEDKSESFSLKEAYQKYEQSLLQLKKAERVRLDLEAKLRLVEATASEYLLRNDLHKLNLEKRMQKARLLVEGSVEQAYYVISDDETQLESLENEYIESILKTFEILKQSTTKIVQSKKYSLIMNLLTACKQAVDGRIQREKAYFAQLRRERYFMISYHFLLQQNYELQEKDTKLKNLYTERKQLEKYYAELQQIDKQISLELAAEKAKFDQYHSVLQDLQKSVLQAQALRQLLGKFDVETAVQEAEFVDQASAVLNILNQTAQVKLLTPDEARLRSDLQGVVANQAGSFEYGCEEAFYGMQQGVCDIEREIEGRLMKLLE